MRRFLLILFLIPLVPSCESDTKDPVFVVFDEPEITHHNYYEIEEYLVAWNKVFDVPLTNYYLYYFSQTCSHCAALKDWIIGEALERKNIYFVQASELDVLSENVSSSLGATSYEKICILGYPSMIKIEQKRVTKNVAGETAIKNLLLN